MQPGLSDMQPTPGWKGDAPGSHDPFPGQRPRLKAPHQIVKRWLKRRRRRRTV